MLELLTDPTMWTLIGGAFSYTALRAVVRGVQEKQQASVESSKVKVLEAEANHCDAYFHRQFEEKLVEEGVITREEMTKCKNADCDECNPTEQRKQNQNRDVCSKCNSPLAYDGICEPCYYHGSPVGRQRIKRPVPVPAYAAFKAEYDGVMNQWLARWKWIDSEGRPQGYSLKMLDPDMYDFESYEIMSGDSDKPVVIFTHGNRQVDFIDYDTAVARYGSMTANEIRSVRSSAPAIETTKGYK